MDAKASSQTKARLLVLLIFVIGFAAGALSMNLYRNSAPSGPGRRGDRDRPPQDHILKKMTDQLGLDSEQQNRIRSILNETFDQYRQIREENEPKIDAVRRKGRERIRASLKPEQVPKYEEMVSQMDKKREEYRDREKK